jgi:hypothetical protein
VNALQKLQKRYNIGSNVVLFTPSKDFLVTSGYDFKRFFTSSCIKYSVIRHQWVAISKMYETVSTEKFIREDGNIRFIDTIYYGYSGPRILTILNFLKDLGLMDRQTNIATPRGIKYYNEL